MPKRSNCSVNHNSYVKNLQWILVFWIMMMWRVVCDYQHFKGYNGPHLQNWSFHHSWNQISNYKIWYFILHKVMKDLFSELLSWQLKLQMWSMYVWLSYKYKDIQACPKSHSNDNKVTALHCLQQVQIIRPFSIDYVLVLLNLLLLLA